MNRLDEFEQLSKDLHGVDAAHAKSAFTTLFKRGCDLLELDDDDAANLFDTSRPNASRWRRGKVVPPAAPLVLKFLREEVESKIKKLKKIQASGTGGSHRASAPGAMAAKGR